MVSDDCSHDVKSLSLSLSPSLSGGGSMTEGRLYLAICQAIFLVGSSLFLAVAAAIPGNLLGVAPHDVTYYKSGPIIWCKDQSKSFSIDRLNDDFCDCPDATDEPGTSACSNGRFFCKNQKQAPFWVFASRVNDGICDCCDGSDEYDGRVQCKPVCLVEVRDVEIQGGNSKEAALTTSSRNSVDHFSSNEEEPDSTSKPIYLKIVVLLEILLVMMALQQFYTWTCHRGSRIRRGLPR